MARRKAYRYRMVGVGPFPTDMLRYDSATAASNEDAAAITESHDLTRRYERRVIAVTSQYGPTLARWSSFGWTLQGAIETW